MAFDELLGMLVEDRPLVDAARSGSTLTLQPPDFLAAAPERPLLLSGEYDMSTVDLLAATLDRAVAAGVGDLVIDLSGVTFMDASSIRVLVTALRALHADERDLVIRRPSRPARRLLEICGFQWLIENGPAVPPAAMEGDR